MRAMSFFFHDTATTEIYTLSLHDALPIYVEEPGRAGGEAGAYGHGGAIGAGGRLGACGLRPTIGGGQPVCQRSEEHTSELQSRLHLVCRLLLEKKKKESIVMLAGVWVGES